MQALARKVARFSLQAWGRSVQAPGWYYQAFERWGPHLAEVECQPAFLPNGCRVDCDLREHVQRHIYFLGAYEPLETYLFTRLLEPGMTVIDAGANVGQYTLLAATAVGPFGAVHAFEPVPNTFARLGHHIQINKLTNIHAYRVALWHEPGTVQLGRAPDMTDNAGAYSIGVTDGTSPIQAPALRLDDYARRHGLSRVGFVKMDIEGAEWFALQGMLALLRRDRPFLLLEINRAALGRLGCSPAELSDLLIHDLGYRAWTIGSSARTCQALATLDEIAQQNVLFHHTDLPETVTAGWNLKSILRWARRRGG
jgi:FkbM family methyltransferase